MSSLRSGYPSRTMAVSLGLLLFTLASLTPLLAQITPSGDAGQQGSWHRRDCRAIA